MQIHTQVTINVSYEGTYAEWKNLIGFINNYEKKNTIEALTTTYNEATDVVTGTMTLALYSITGNGRCIDSFLETYIISLICAA